MSELDDQISIELASSSKSCKVCAWLEKQDPEIVKSFDQYVASGLEAAKLTRACARLKDPLDCDPSTTRRHLRGCPR